MKKISGIAILFVGILSVPAYAQRYAFFPEIASGGGWTSEFFFTNQGLSKVSGIMVDFYGTNGVPLSVTSNLGTGFGYSFDLNAGATQVIRITPPVTLVEGYVEITYPDLGSPVRASEVYRYEQGGTVKVEVGVPQQEFGEHYSFPVEINPAESIDTAVVILNPAIVDYAQTIVVNLIRLDGSVQATATMPMDPGEQFAGYFYENELFPGLTSFVGSVSISSPFGVGVLALRQDHQAFGAIATDGGPILGPFALSGNAVAEHEPNDTDTEAQLINGSQIISGTIGVTIGGIEDQDWFKFTGKAGDIISVTCEAQETGSYLDSVLEIYDDSSLDSPIAWNDQNGLAPQGYPINDSFVQTVLPADGTYYIKVSDYWGDGGSNFTYTLHVKLP